MFDRLFHKLETAFTPEELGLVHLLYTPSDKAVSIQLDGNTVFEGDVEGAIAYLVDRKRGQHSGTCVVRMDSDRNDDMDV